MFKRKSLVLFTIGLLLFSIALVDEVKSVTYYLTINQSTDSYGTIAGTTDPAAGSHSYSGGTSVDVTAYPNSGYSFNHWELDGANAGSANPITVTMNSNHTLTAFFAPILTISSTLGGTVDPPEGWYYYTTGTVVSVRATAGEGAWFDHWEKDGVPVGSTNPYSITMDQNHTLHAVFRYFVYVRAYCYISDSYQSLSFSLDGSGYSTPHNFTVLEGYHTISFPSSDPHGHPFLRWKRMNTGGESTTVAVPAGGNLTAYYWQESPNPRIFVAPSNIGGDGVPSPGSVATVKVNVSSTPSPGLWSYDFKLALNRTVFPPLRPITNMNFTDSTAWTTTATVTAGTASYGYDAGDGNPAPGSGAPSYFHRANSTAGATASIVFSTEQTFTYSFSTPVDARLSYSYEVTGNSIGSGSNLGIRVVKPDLTTKTLISTKSITATSPWSYTVNYDTSETAFDLVGTYKFQFRNTLRTAAVGTDKYVQVNWDDIGIELLPITVTEGSTLKTGGPTFLMWNYYSAGYISVTESITGDAYVNAWPVPGNYTLLTIDMPVDYGNATLDLYDTVLRTLDVYRNPVPYAHTSADGYFSNKLYGDVDSDRDVDESDLESFSNAYGSENGNCDFNKDNIVDVIDLFSLGKNYGKEV